MYFFSFTISFKKFSRNFNGDIFLLVFVIFTAESVFASRTGSDAGSDVD